MSEFNRFCGNDPNFPGVPFTASMSVGIIRDNLLAVHKSLEGRPEFSEERKLLVSSLDILEELFLDIQSTGGRGGQ